jgi:hypothetical protein
MLSRHENGEDRAARTEEQAAFTLEKEVRTFKAVKSVLGTNNILQYCPMQVNTTHPPHDWPAISEPLMKECPSHICRRLLIYNRST